MWVAVLLAGFLVVLGHSELAICLAETPLHYKQQSKCINRSIAQSLR
jgi:hypothetical protein